MRKKRGLLFFIFLGIIFLLEGLGIPYGRVIAFYGIIAMPVFLSLCEKWFFSKKTQKQLLIPQELLIPGRVFILFTFLSTLFSVDKNQSFLYLLFYLSLFLLFIYSYSYREELKKYIVPFIFTFSFIFSLYTTLILFLVRHKVFLLVPTRGYQFVYSVFGSHNHLGDFLILPLGYIVYSLSRKGCNWKLFFISIFFFIHFIFSFSRSAYADFSGLCLLIYFFSQNRSKRFLPVLMLLFVSLFILTISITTSSNLKMTQSLHSFFMTKSALQKKFPFAQRNDYLLDGLKSMRQNLVLGIGPGNFQYASSTYASTVRNFWTETAHNIFLDIGVENGVVALFAFIWILFLILKRSKKELYFFLSIGMLFNFQTDYTYRIFSLFLLFVIILTVQMPKQKTIRFKQFGRVSAVLLMLVMCILTSYLFLSQKKYSSSLAFYPLNKQTYRELIQRKNNDRPYIRNSDLPKVYSGLFVGDAVVQQYIADMYYKNRAYPISLHYYERAYDDSFIQMTGFAGRIYILKGKYEGKKQANTFITNFFRRYESLPDKLFMGYDKKIATIKLCQKIYVYHCPYYLQD